MKIKTKTKKQVRLPSKMSNLLSLAFKDFESIEKTPGYRIHMGSWHSYNEDYQQCFVCMSGAVMANTLKVPRKRFQPPSYSRWNGKIVQKLIAIDYLRKGLVYEAAVELDIDPDVFRFSSLNRPICPYAINIEAFKTDIRKLIKDLKDKNL